MFCNIVRASLIQKKKINTHNVYNVKIPGKKNFLGKKKKKLEKTMNSGILNITGEK